MLLIRALREYPTTVLSIIIQVLILVHIMLLIRALHEYPTTVLGIILQVLMLVHIILLIRALHEYPTTVLSIITGIIIRRRPPGPGQVKRGLFLAPEWTSEPGNLS
jgi:hypothetical protein